jgi:hypothetical protein
MQLHDALAALVQNVLHLGLVCLSAKIFLKALLVRQEDWLPDAHCITVSPAPVDVKLADRFGGTLILTMAKSVVLSRTLQTGHVRSDMHS